MLEDMSESQNASRIKAACKWFIQKQYRGLRYQSGGQSDFLFLPVRVTPNRPISLASELKQIEQTLDVVDQHFAVDIVKPPDTEQQFAPVPSTGNHG